MSVLFSIIIPTHNRAHMISRGIESVINQTYPHWELIIIDDGSTDKTKEVVEGYNDPRIRYLWQENQERSVARNNGIDQATGDWICFLDSDDWYVEDCLMIFHEVIQRNSKETLIKANFNVVDQANNLILKTKTYQGDIDGQQLFVAGKFGTLMNFSFSRKSIGDVRFKNIQAWEDKCFIINVLNEHSFFETGKTIGYLLEHNDRSVKKPLDVSRAKNVVNVMRKTFSNTASLSKWAAFKTVLNWQRNFLHTHYSYYKSIPKYFGLLIQFSPFNILLWSDSIRILFFPKI